MSARELVLDAVSAGYSERPDVVRGVDLQLRPGESVALIGSSGAGKTTLLRVLARLGAPTAGRVRLGEHDLHSAASAHEVRSAIGLVPQQHALPPSLRADAAVTTGAAGQWSFATALRVAALGPSRTEREAAESVLAQVGLGGRGRERVATLSVGERQRVAVARTLLQDPAVVLADEPVASVDPSTARTILRLLSNRAAEGAIVLCSVHDVQKARDHFDRIVAMRAGEIVFDGPSARLTDEIATFVYDGEVCA